MGHQKKTKIKMQYGECQFPQNIGAIYHKDALINRGKQKKENSEKWNEWTHKLKSRIVSLIQETQYVEQNRRELKKKLGEVQTLPQITYSIF